MLQSIVSGNNGSPSPLTSPNEMCRICHCEAENEAPLITPCICSGSLQYVHQACLQQWIKSSDTKNCELCKFEFLMQTKIKPFLKWEKLEMTAAERRKIFCSVSFHFVAITCVVWSLYVLIERTTDEVKSGHLEWPFWTKLIVVGIGFTGGLIFMYVQCKMYIQLCRRWKAFNRIIYVQNAPEKIKPPAAVSPTRNALDTAPSGAKMLYATTESVLETHFGDGKVATRTSPTSPDAFSPLPPVASSPPTSLVPLASLSDSHSNTRILNNNTFNEFLENKK